MNNLSRARGNALLFFSFIFLILSFPSRGQAVALPEIVVNEISWMGTKIEGTESKNWWRYEWFELYNNTEQNISLNGWKIELYRADLDWFLELKGSILAQDYFLIVASEKISPNYDLNYSNLGGKFVNGGQRVLLKNNQGQVIDQIDCSSGWFAGDNETKQTMERKNSRVPGSEVANWEKSKSTSGTPRTENSIIIPQVPIEIQTADVTDKAAESPVETTVEKTTETEQPTETKNQTKYPRGIIINEILPSPEGADEENEWFEIFNQNNFEADISGWKISDLSGKTTLYIVPEGTKIKANGFLIFSRPTTKIVLNNDADGLKIAQPDGNILETVNYEKAPLGKSFCRQGNSWAWTTAPTPANINKFFAPDNGEDDLEIDAQQNSSVNKEFGEKGMAEMSKQMPKFSLDRGLYIFLIPLSLAILSGFAILSLKRKIK